MPKWRDISISDNNITNKSFKKENLAIDSRWKLFFMVSMALYLFISIISYIILSEKNSRINKYSYSLSSELSNCISKNEEISKEKLASEKKMIDKEMELKRNIEIRNKRIKKLEENLTDSYIEIKELQNMLRLKKHRDNVQ